MRALLAAAALALSACSDRSPDAALRRAAAQRDARKVAKLIEKGAAVDARDENGWTPLMWAAARGDQGTVRVLLSAKADLSASSRRERQASLTLAARWNKTEVVRALAQGGADLGQRDSLGWTALMWASLQGRTDVVEALLEAGADAQARDSSGNTPLILAARRGRIDVVKALLARGASAGARSNDGETAASVAAKGGYPELASLLKK